MYSIAPAGPTWRRASKLPVAGAGAVRRCGDGAGVRGGTERGRVRHVLHGSRLWQLARTRGTGDQAAGDGGETDEDEAERQAVLGPPDGREARAISMSYEYGADQNGPDSEAIRSGVAVPLPGESAPLGLMTIFTRSPDLTFKEEQVAELTAEPFEQTQGDVVLTALMSSSSSVAPAAAVDVGETAAGGRPTLLLRLRVEGHLRWKVASWVSGRRALAAECVAVVVLQPAQQLSRAVVVQGSQCATTLQ
jgi:hypothetical protein